MRRIVLTAIACFCCAFAAQGEKIPPAVTSDPPINATFPARTEIIHVPSGGVEINGIVYVAAGPGPHPTVILFHGLPGNEKNLDLAQAIRRAGWTVVAVNYRGSWGSPGHFAFAQNLEDGEATLAFVRKPDNAATLNVDPARIVLIGHSMGGWVTLNVAAKHPEILGAVTISAADLGAIGQLAQRDHGAAIAFLGDTGGTESLVESTLETQAKELADHAADWSFLHMAPDLVDTRLYMLSAKDPFEADSAGLVAAIKAKGGKKVRARLVPTNHVWSDRRILLEALVINWLTGLPGRS